jgi:CubicO group peptidase (beta-lactamase class C family)
MTTSRLDRTVETLPRTYAGPGGAIAVLRDGQVLVRHTWGWANAERRIRFTPRTLFRMCSITKQFTCALVLDAFPDPSVLDGDVRARLPLLRQAAPGAVHLCHNQSGMRDYWALAMLHGSPVEAPFGESEAARIIGSTQTLQFVPGTRFSYVNQNFRLLSDILAERAGRGFAELLRSRIFDPAGMDSALLAADTGAMPDGTTGYEGSVASGFRAAENRILWTGDAGLGASLDDMIAWERFIDATRDDPDGLYRRLSSQVRFGDGGEAAYGFGLSRSTEFGRRVIGHGGALPVGEATGFTCRRSGCRSLSFSITWPTPSTRRGICLALYWERRGRERMRPFQRRNGSARTSSRRSVSRCASMRGLVGGSGCGSATRRRNWTCERTARRGPTTARCFGLARTGCGWIARGKIGVPAYGVWTAKR